MLTNKHQILENLYPDHRSLWEYDTTLPQRWLDNLAAEIGQACAYDILRANTVWAYPFDRSSPYHLTGGPVFLTQEAYQLADSVGEGADEINLKWR